MIILINPYEHGVGLVISGDIISHGSPTDNCKDIVFNLFWHYLNTHLGEDELSIFFEFEKNLLMVLSTPLLGFSEMRKKWIIHLHLNACLNHSKNIPETIPTRKQLAHRIVYATWELNHPFYVNYYLIHTRSKIGYIIQKLKINYPNKIEGHHSFNNETCILHITRDYTSNTTSTTSLVVTENRTIHVTIRTLTDLEKFMSVYLNTAINSIIYVI